MSAKPTESQCCVSPIVQTVTSVTPNTVYLKCTRLYEAPVLTHTGEFVSTINNKMGLIRLDPFQWHLMKNFTWNPGIQPRAKETSKATPEFS